MTRAEARAANLVHFEGNPCGTCGKTLRYTSSNGCVTCALVGDENTREAAQLKRVVRDAALTLGQKRYQGHDCGALHGGLRYTSSGECVECRKVIDARTRVNAKARHEEELRPKAPPIVRPNPTPDAAAWVSCIKPPTLAMLMGRRAP